MNTLREITEFTGISGPNKFQGWSYGLVPQPNMRWVGTMIPVFSPIEKTSLKAMGQAFRNLRPISLEAEAEDTNGEEPLAPRIHIHATDGVVLETCIAILQSGRTIGLAEGDHIGYAKNLGAGDSFDSYVTVGPGSYIFRVRRIGIQNTGVTTLIKDFDVICSAHPTTPTPVPLPPPTKPTISNVVNKGAGNFEVKGSGFLKSHDVHLRVVNDATFASNLYTGNSDGSGGLDMMITIPGLSSGTTLDFSANDERPDPSDITGTLWSTTFKITV